MYPFYIVSANRTFPPDGEKRRYSGITTKFSARQLSFLPACTRPRFTDISVASPLRHCVPSSHFHGCRSQRIETVVGPPEHGDYRRIR